MKLYGMMFVCVAWGATCVAQSGEGVLARCGASRGHAYFAYDELMNPDGPTWEDDGMSSGKIILVRLGEEWDIQFDDVAGSYGYRQDGADVFPLGRAGGKLMVGAFRGTYTDIYTFDFAAEEVLWTTHKIGTPIPKVAIYRAECSFMDSLPG